MVHLKLKLCKTYNNPVLDLAWCLLRLPPRGVVPMPNGVNITPEQIIPIWYGFYHNLSRERTSYTTVLHTPIIYAKPVDMATMYTTMRKCKELSIALDQHHSFKTIDHQLHAFALHLKWAFSE